MTTFTIAASQLKSPQVRIEQLIAINQESCRAYCEALEYLVDQSMRQCFTEIGFDRSRQSVELQAVLLAEKGLPQNRQADSSTPMRPIMNWSADFERGDLAILLRALRSEEYVRAKYESALTFVGQRFAEERLAKQYTQVKVAHERILLLRDAYTLAIKPSNQLAR